MDIKNSIKEVLETTLSELEISGINIEIEVPADKKNGDFSSNVAMKAASLLKQNPRDIANKIKENIGQNSYIDRIEVAGPGFLNFFTNKKVLFNIINEVIELGDEFGRSNIGNGIKLDVEFASVNPTGFIHLGHARGSAYGDNICRILSFAGYDVTREYYINDGGNQIDNMGLSIKERYRGFCGLPENMPEGGY